MVRGIGCAALLLCGSAALSNNIVYECGKSSSLGFDGWSIYPYNAFSAVEFTEETVSFHVADGGEYTIILTRHIEAMRRYAEMQFDIQFGAIKNCALNFIDVYVSADGKNWEAIDLRQHQWSGIIENNAGYEYLRIAANVSFYKDGSIECSYVRLAGEEPVSLIEKEADPMEELNAFFVFAFNKSINVETRNEEPYEVIFTNLAGQIMYRESAVGSTRIESSLPEGVYLVSVIQHGAVVHTKKVLF